MLPFLQLQIAYAALSLALALLAGLAVRKSVPGSGPVARAALTLAGVAAIALVLGAVLAALGEPMAGLFVAIAIVFYAGGFWVPVLLLAAASRRNSGAPASRAAAIALAAAAPALALHALLVEPNRLQVREERVPIDAWSAKTPPLRLLHLSDLQTVGACERERAALDAIRGLAPDLIVITGDYIAGPFFDTAPAEAAARAFLGALPGIAPTVVVAGHSEGEDVRRRVFEGLDLAYLEDVARDFDFGDGRSLRVVGLDPFRPDLRLPRQAPPPGTALVVATHSPDETAGLEGTFVDLHLAGHTHGGQVALPFLGPPITLTALPRRYARGLFEMKGHWLNVCAGLGMEGNHAPRIRVLCPPEICLIRLEGTGPEPNRASD